MNGTWWFLNTNDRTERVDAFHVVYGIGLRVGNERIALLLTARWKMDHASSFVTFSTGRAGDA